MKTRQLTYLIIIRVNTLNLTSNCEFIYSFATLLFLFPFAHHRLPELIVLSRHSDSTSRSTQTRRHCKLVAGLRISSEFGYTLEHLIHVDPVSSARLKVAVNLVLFAPFTRLNLTYHSL
jgi:hypothetical protein